MRGGLHQYFRRVHQIWTFSQVGSAISVLLTKSQFEHRQWAGLLVRRAVPPSSSQ